MITSNTLIHRTVTRRLQIRQPVTIVVGEQDWRVDECYISVETEITESDKLLEIAVPFVGQPSSVIRLFVRGQNFATVAGYFGASNPMVIAPDFSKVTLDPKYTTLGEAKARTPVENMLGFFLTEMRKLSEEEQGELVKELGEYGVHLSWDKSFVQTMPSD